MLLFVEEFRFDYIIFVSLVRQLPRRTHHLRFGIDFIWIKQFFSFVNIGRFFGQLNLFDNDGQLLLFVRKLSRRSTRIFQPISKWNDGTAVSLRNQIVVFAGKIFIYCLSYDLREWAANLFRESTGRLLSVDFGSLDTTEKAERERGGWREGKEENSEGCQNFVHFLVVRLLGLNRFRWWIANDVVATFARRGGGGGGNKNYGTSTYLYDQTIFELAYTKDIVIDSFNLSGLLMKRLTRCCELPLSCECQQKCQQKMEGMCTGKEAKATLLRIVWSLGFFFRMYGCRQN